MNRQRVLVSGASIAGLSTAFWFDRLGWEVTVLERAPEFRDGGQNVDVRAEARDAVRLMGIHDAIQAQTTTEEGTVFVDAHGRVVGRFPVGDGDGLTAQLEILRGDLARVVLDALPPRVQVRYGERISAVRDLYGGVEVDVAGAAGEAGEAGDAGAGAATERYDLVVIAEGVGSPTRDRVFGAEVGRRELGMNVAYGTIPRTADDDRWWHWLFVPGRRQVSLRPDNHGTTRATLSFMSSTSLARMPRDEALWRLRGVFADAGPLARRILDGFDDSDDVYVDHLTQIRMATWHRGRVCVTGDAAWCPTPIGGGGSSLALTGAYVLAAFVSQHPDDLDSALGLYEEWMRPVVDDAQNLPPGTPGLAHPATRRQITLLHTAIRAAASRPVRAVLSRMGGGGGDTTRLLPSMRAGGAVADHTSDD